MIYLKMLQLDFPEEAAVTVQGFVEVAGFDFPFINADFMLQWLVELPTDTESIVREDLDDERYITNLEEFGFESRFCSRVYGSPFLLFLITDFVYLLLPIAKRT